MKIGYARVSTDEQNLDAQIDALNAAGCDRVFVDQGVSGATIERDGLDQALATVMGPGGVLVVWKLDRLGRSLSFLIDLIDQLGRQGAGFQSLSESIDTTTAGGKLIFHVMGALAEFERSLISERTKGGMAAARRRGKSIGRPKALSQAQVDHARERIAAGGETISGMADILAVDRKTLSRALRSVGEEHHQTHRFRHIDHNN
ncbi:recombinase family protein [Hoeflea sp. CAU 1731]